MILKDGRIITVDPASTIAQAIAIAADRIIAIGPNDAMAVHTRSLSI
jgi:predicted amidohydrolase YtcJ